MANLQGSRSSLDHTLKVQFFVPCSVLVVVVSTLTVWLDFLPLNRSIHRLAVALSKVWDVGSFPSALEVWKWVQYPSGGDLIKQRMNKSANGPNIEETVVSRPKLYRKSDRIRNLLVVTVSIVGTVLRKLQYAHQANKIPLSLVI